MLIFRITGRCDIGFGRVGDSCVPCEPGMYKGEVADIPCVNPCGEQFTNLRSGVSLSQCFCQPGAFYVAVRILPSNTHSLHSNLCPSFSAQSHILIDRSSWRSSMTISLNATNIQYYR